MVARRRNVVSSKTLFDHPAPPKPIELEPENPEPLDNSTSSASGSSAGTSRSKDSVRSFLRRSRSKLLSIFRLRSNDSGISGKMPTTLHPASKNQQEINPHCQVNTDGQTILNLDDCDTVAAPTVLLTPFSSLRISTKSNKNPKREDYAGQGHLEKGHPTAEEEDIGDRPLPPSVPRRHSSPGLSHLLSHKISSTFGNPTVIHRASLRQRPSIHSFSFTPPSSSIHELQKLGDSAQDGSDSSSSANSGIGSSPRTQSTDPTSDGAPITQSSKPSDKQCSPGSDTITSKVQPLSRITPSIISVEAAAAARIALETYYNDMLFKEPPRAERQRELEEKIYLLNLSPDESTKAKLAWYRQESEHTRQDRVLKAWSNCTRVKESMSVAGYEPLKVLGKGSFGVVRLVREKHTFKDISEIPKSGSYGDKKSSPFDTLRTTADSSRNARRKDVSKMKKDVYAMKVIRKAEMIRNCQEGHLRAERDFLVASAKSRWIVPLIASFQDAHNLYLVMDYMVGGDFLSLLIRKNILSENIARWYVAEMILCVEETHRLRWIHRDVKPDNFLISASGHLKISDFGLAFDGHWSHDQAYFTNQRLALISKLRIQIEGDSKDRKEASEASPKDGKAEFSSHHNRPASIPGPGPDDDILRYRNRKERKKLAKSVVGTSQYMAPEVIRGDPYDGRCDWWSIGIILYECLYGFTPFASKTRHDTKEKIIHHRRTLYFPTDRHSDRLVSDDAIDLIMRILQPKEYRICSEKYLLNDYVHSGRIPGELLDYPSNKELRNYRGYHVYPDDATDIKNHPFFRNIRWDELHYRIPPFIPKIKSWEDTKYFEGEQVSDVPDGSSEVSPVEEPGAHSGEQFDKSLKPQLDGGSGVGGKVGGKSKTGILASLGVTIQNKPQKKKKEKKRARDKILRDERVGKTALDMRKKNAFLGYSYRRPKDVILALESERGRTASPIQR